VCARTRPRSVAGTKRRRSALLTLLAKTTTKRSLAEVDRTPWRRYEQIRKLAAAVTIRPTPVMRWGASLAVIAIGGLVLLGPIKNMVSRRETSSAADVVLALVFIVAGVTFIATGVIAWSSFIQVDETSVVLGSLLTRRRCDRHDIARITVSAAPGDRFARLIRSDGSVAIGTSGYLWGRVKLKSLADYLGVPLVW
jgi:hypothetical protein